MIAPVRVNHWFIMRWIWRKICLQICSLILLLGLAFGQNCQSGDANKSCGQCIKEGPDCAWCGDSDYSGNFRCDQRSNLDGKCREIFQPKSEVQETQDNAIGSAKPGMNGTQVQVQPQQIQVKIRPGETVTFKIKYLHVQPTIATIYALNSEVESQGFSISYSVSCRGAQIPGRQCEGTRQSDIVEYTVSLRLMECRTSGSAVVSIGIGGVRDVVAVYISPICGCECEKLSLQKKFSPTCNGQGTLVCGKCVCEPGVGGDKCECGAGDGESLADQCRARPGEVECSGRGKCDCGKCKCDATYYSGTYCECDETSCPLSGGMMCFGKGACNCGTCECERDWTGRACDCSLSLDKCTDDRGGQCNGRGMCDCNKCKCDSGYTGELCENEPTEETPLGSYEEEYQELTTTESVAVAETTTKEENSVESETTTAPKSEEETTTSAARSNEMMFGLSRIGAVLFWLVFIGLILV